jgi:hypothetical protein
MSIGKGRCLDDNRFQNILCGHHKKANLDRPATPMVLDWGDENSEVHPLIAPQIN